MFVSRTLGILILIGITIFISYQTHAQTNSDKSSAQVNIAVLNLENIRRNATVIQGIHKQISELENEIKQGLNKEEETLRIANQDLAKKRAILAPDAYAQERKIFEQSVLKVQRMVQMKKQLLNRAKRAALAKVEKILNKLVADLAAERGLLLVLRTDQTVLASRKLDITKIILKQLNSKLSELKVEIPKK